MDNSDNTDTIENHIDTLIEESIKNIKQETNNQSSENSEPIVHNNVEGFNAALHQYLELEEEIKVLLNAIKIRNQKKKHLGLSLSTYLREHKISNVNLGGTYKGKKLESVVSHKTVGFNKVSVTDAIYNELKNDDEVFSKIMEAISKKSIMTEIWKIKISSDKVSKDKKEKNNISMAEELLNGDE